MVRFWQRLAVLALVTSPVEAEVSTSGYVALEPRVYDSSGRFPGQDHQQSLALVVNPEWRWGGLFSAHQFRFAPYLRKTWGDDYDLLDVRQGFWRYNARNLSLLVGVDTVFWGVAESRHLVDVINQPDLQANLEGEEKLGQPMVQLSSTRSWGTLSYYLLPYFRDREFPDPDSRVLLRPPVPVRSARYESGAGEHRLDQALRFSKTRDGWDAGIYLFNGTARDPAFLPIQGGAALRPFHEVINQVGVDIQHTSDSLLWKFEGLYRNGSLDTFYATVAGFEYTLFQVADSSSDLGLLVEHLWDDRSDDAPPTIYQNDLFLGTRLAVNDPQDTTFLLGVIHDLEQSEALLSLEAERRLPAGFSVNVDAKVFLGAWPGANLWWPSKDDYLDISIRYNF